MVGTGGTITGVYLESKNSQIKVVAVESANSSVLSKGTGGSQGIQCIGAGFVLQILDTKVYDKFLTVQDEAAFECVKITAKKKVFIWNFFRYCNLNCKAF